MADSQSHRVVDLKAACKALGLEISGELKASNHQQCQCTSAKRTEQIFSWQAALVYV